MKPAAVLLSIAALASCAPGPTLGSGNSVTPTESATATSTGEATPTVGPAASTTPLPSPSAEFQPTGVRANALGRLTGNWLFVGKQVPSALNVRAEVQIWAIPLDGGAPKFAFGYEVSLGGAPEGIFDNTPYLRRQFSPDGTRMVVSVEGQLVVVNLMTGQTKDLGVTGFFPSWSKDGSRIAFLFQLPVVNVVPPESAIGMIPAGGGPVKQLAIVGYARQSIEWSPDGSMLLVAEPDRTIILDVANGNVIRSFPETTPSGSSFAHWRSAASQIALAVGSCDRTTMKLLTLGDASEPYVTQLDTGKRCPELSLRDPRWSPTRATEVLYVATRAEPGRMPSEYRAHVLDTYSGKDVALPFEVYEATWTWDGERIAYLTANVDRGIGDSVGVSRRDGTGSRNLLKATDRDFFFSVASVAY